MRGLLLTPTRNSGSPSDRSSWFWLETHESRSSRSGGRADRGGCRDASARDPHVCSVRCALQPAAFLTVCCSVSSSACEPGLCCVGTSKAHRFSGCMFSERLYYARFVNLQKRFTRCRISQIVGQHCKVSEHSGQNKKTAHAAKRFLEAPSPQHQGAGSTLVLQEILLF